MKEKHFLDTSILRPLFTSTSKVKKYYQDKLVGKIYVCNYVKMEFLRGYIRNCIDFYILLDMPQYESFSEVLQIWSHKFAIREHKNIEIMLSNLISHNNCVDDKEKSLRVLADYIRRMIGKLHNNFNSYGTDNTNYSKGNLKLNFDPENITDCFLEYSNIIKNNEEYKNCSIDRFVREKNMHVITKLLTNTISNDFGSRKGFDKLIEQLEIIQNGKKLTCAACSTIGDVIISILLEDGFSLEHSDFSFNYLCEILKKEHNQHPYDAKIIKKSL